MKKEEFDKYLVDRYEDQLAWYDKKAIWNHKIYQRFQWIAIILSAITPVLVIAGEGWTRWLAVFVAVVVAICIAALKTFSYQDNWISYRTTCETLKKEKHFYKANIQGYEKVENKEALFVEQVESLISRENTLWLVKHKRDERSY